MVIVKKPDLSKMDVDQLIPLVRSGLIVPSEIPQRLRTNVEDRVKQLEEEERARENEKKSMTKADIKEELDSLGVEYNPKAKKDELLLLLEEAES